MGTSWRVAGTYYEACNCEAICPCRRRGNLPGGRSTYGVCDFALSWLVIEGHAGAIDLDGLAVVMVGTYSDDEPGSPWRVALYVDERGTKEQRDALATIFLGRAGGTVLRNFAAAIQGVYAIRPARIEIEHVAGRERFRVPDRVEVIAAGPVATNVAVTCAIPGHDRAGHEVIAEVMRVEEAPLSWEVRGRCSYAATFDYVGDAPTTPLMYRLPAMGMSKSPSLDRQGEARAVNIAGRERVRQSGAHTLRRTA